MIKRELYEDKMPVGMSNTKAPVLIYSFNYGIDDTVIYSDANRTSYHSSKIYSGVNERFYFKAFGRRIYFDDCIILNYTGVTLSNV